MKTFAKVMAVVLMLGVVAACANSGQNVNDAKKTGVERRSWDK